MELWHKFKCSEVFQIPQGGLIKQKDSFWKQLKISLSPGRLEDLFSQIPITLVNLLKCVLYKMKGSFSKLFQRWGILLSFLPSQDNRKMLTGQNDATKASLLKWCITPITCQSCIQFLCLIYKKQPLQGFLVGSVTWDWNSRVSILL